jgi:multidrug resistance efflux pump
VFALALAACNAGGAAPTPAVDIPIVTDSGGVIAEGRLEPGAYAQLSFLTGGQVAEVLVKEGDTVEAGAVLARLQNRESLNAQVAQAEQAVFDAGQAIKDLNDTVALSAAQTQKEVAQIQDELEAAERRLRSVASPDVDFYQDQYDRAQQRLTAAQQNAEITNFETSLRAAEDVLERATDDLKKYKDLEALYPGYGQMHGDILEETQKFYDRAVEDHQAAQYALQQAQANNANTITDAQKALNTARGNLAAAKAGPDAVELALAQADVALIKARLEDAQDRLSTLQSGPDPDHLASAQARLATAEANLAAAKAAFEDAELKTPISGTVADLKLKVGEQASPGQPAVTLAEFERWVVKTNNLTETDVVRVKVGQAAEVVLDALPEVALKGTVTAISPVFVESRGDVTYTVTIELIDADPSMRWGMTAQVTLAP